MRYSYIRLFWLSSHRASCMECIHVGLQLAVKEINSLLLQECHAQVGSCGESVWVFLGSSTELLGTMTGYHHAHALWWSQISQLLAAACFIGFPFKIFKSLVFTKGVINVTICLQHPLGGSSQLASSSSPWLGSPLGRVSLVINGL